MVIINSCEPYTASKVKLYFCFAPSTALCALFSAFSSDSFTFSADVLRATLFLRFDFISIWPSAAWAAVPSFFEGLLLRSRSLVHAAPDFPGHRSYRVERSNLLD